MIEIMSDLPDNVVDLSAIGKVTRYDYESILIPEIEKKLKQHAKISLLYHLGNGFTGFEAEAMWDDAKVGLHYLTAWHRIAVVSDVDWIRRFVKIFGFTMPGHVKIFSNNRLAEARAWVSG
jgi:hypothetical protein